MLNPATLHDPHRRVLDTVRSTKAGMLNPATPAARRCRRAGGTPLNEGRDVKPGDTRALAAGGLPAAGRSTKAGMLNPATRRGRRRSGPRWRPLNEGRDVKPGDTGPRGRRRAARHALNEGRDVKPGDTLPGLPSSPPAAPLNEGRDVKPGDTTATSKPVGESIIAQRRPGC